MWESPFTYDRMFDLIFLDICLISYFSSGKCYLTKKCKKHQRLSERSRRWCVVRWFEEWWVETNREWDRWGGCCGDLKLRAGQAELKCGEGKCHKRQLPDSLLRYPPVCPGSPQLPLLSPNISATVRFSKIEHVKFILIFPIFTEIKTSKI